MIGILHKLLL